MIDISKTLEPPSHGLPVAINDSGQVLAVMNTAPHDFLWDPYRRGFIYDHGKVTELGTLGGPWSNPKGWNSKGQIYGDSGTSSTDVTQFRAHAFIYANGAMADLGTLGGTYSEASQINELGQVIGISSGADGTMHSFLYSDGSMMDFEDSSGTAARKFMT